MGAHCVLRSILSDDGVIRESEEGGGSHAQFIHGMCTKRDSLTREGNHLVQKQIHNNEYLKCDATGRQWLMEYMYCIYLILNNVEPDRRCLDRISLVSGDPMATVVVRTLLSEIKKFY